MKMFGLIAVIFGCVAVTAFANTIAEHGGGCRKSSPPGMCCHMDRKTGVVHCH